MSRLLCIAALVAALAPEHAHAQPPIADSDYSIDLGAGPVLGSGRIIGLGGAYTAIAEGIDGAPWNPAAYGSRVLWELDWWEWELTAGLLFPGSFSGDDFFNTGDGNGAIFDNSLFLSFGYRLQFGDVGFGALVRLWTYRLQSPDGSGDEININFIQGNYGIAHQFLDGQLVLGFGARTASLDLTSGPGEPLVNFTSTGAEVGALLRLADQRWRLGAAARAPVEPSGVLPDETICDDSTGVQICEAGGFVLPSAVRLPWEVQVGIAVQIGRRPINTRWVNPEDEENELRSRMVMRQHERERLQLERELEATGEAWPEDDPYRWLPRRASDPEFIQRERELHEHESEELDEQMDEAEERRDELVRNLTRFYLLLSADLIVQGRVGDAVGVPGFLSQRFRQSGDDVTYGVRFGVEGEPWGDRLKLRAGTYLEPSRFQGGSYRVHGTGGFDLRLFTWDLFGLFDDFDIRAGLTIDVAQRFFDWGIGVGFWH